jgi:hypothetical protein
MRYTPGTTRLELRVRVFPQKAWLKPIVMLHTSHPTTSNESAALFLGLFTCLTGQTFSIIAAGLNSVAASPSASPIHTGQSCGSKITGIWPCIHQQSRSRAL